MDIKIHSECPYCGHENFVADEINENERAKIDVYCDYSHDGCSQCDESYTIEVMLHK